MRAFARCFSGAVAVFVGNATLAPVLRTSCPGRSADWKRLIALVTPLGIQV